MTREPRIINSARRRGFADEDMLHAYRMPLRIVEVGDEMTMFIGPDYSGNLLEVGVVESATGPVIVHAMKARGKFLE